MDRHDDVTGVLHRDLLLRMLFRETDRVQRLRSELSLMLIAIDGFDRWRNEADPKGYDGLLHEVANRIAKTLRSYDLFGSTREAEFLAALPGCILDDALALARRMQVEIFGEPFFMLDKHRAQVAVELSASFAVVSSRGRSPLVVLREAETLIEQVRRQGVGLLPEPEIDRTMEKPAAGVQRGAAADRRGKPAWQIPLLGMSDGRHES